MSALEHALPTCFESSFEGRVAHYMQDLFGARMQGRRAELARAEENLAQKSEPPGSATPYESLRAVSIDQGWDDIEVAQASKLGSAVVRLPARGWLKERPTWLIAPAAALLLTALSLSVLSHLRSGTPSNDGLTSDLLPMTPTSEAQPLPAPQPAVARAAAPVAAPDLNEVSPPPSPRVAGTPIGLLPTERYEPLRRFRAAAPLPRKNAPVTAPSSQTPGNASPSTPSASAPPKKVNPWDTSNFGGRM